jgi:YgiT-type zinc finger domain-containing protein
MSLDQTPPGDAPPACPRCGAAMTAATVRATFWRDERPALVEDIPAHLCAVCLEQFYDEDVGDALFTLAEQGFSSECADRHILVPVFSMKERIRRRVSPPPDCHVE